MKILLAGLRPGMHEFRFEELPARWGLENHPNLRAPVHLSVQLEKGATAIYVRNRIDTVGRFTCDRCLEEFSLPLQDEGRVIFSSDADLVTAGDEELRAYDPEAHEIDLSEDIRDLLVLAIPAKLLCREDCQGLCAGCGANLNTESCRCAATRMDPRWQPLQKLLNH